MSGIPDFIDIIPNPIPVPSIAVYDGCDWALTAIPGGITCADVMTCVQPTLDAMNAVIATKITCDNLISCPVIQNINTEITNMPGIILSQVSWNLNDTVSAQAIENAHTLTMRGLRGMRVRWQGPYDIAIDLPTGGDTGDILTINDDGNATWRPLLYCLCEEVIACVQPLLDALQNQINNISS